MTEKDNTTFYNFYYSKKYLLDDIQPFTERQKNKYTIQDQNFIRYIQVCYNISKREAIKRFNQYNKDLIKNKEKRNEFRLSLSEQYEGLIKYQHRPKNYVELYDSGNKKFLEKFGEGKKYKYPKSKLIIPKEVEERFIMVNKKSRRYLDTFTGQEISRRQHDKIVTQLSTVIE